MNDKHLSLGLTGQDRVNHSLGGGIPRGSTMFIQGPDGGGKSVWTQRLAYGLCEEGYTTTYISTELTSKEFLEQMNSLSYDVVDHLLDGQMLFLDADVDTHQNIGGEAHGERNLIPNLMDESLMLWDADVIVIDEFGALLRNDPAFDKSTEHGDEDHTMQTLIAFLNHLTNKGKTLILTAESESLTDKALRPLRDTADIYFDIETQQVGQEIRRNIAVRRFREMKNPVDDSIGYSVQQGRGITIESRTVA